MLALAQRYPTGVFLGLTFAIALVPWFICYLNAVDPFSDPRWMPLLLVMVWAPTVSAFLVAGSNGNARQLLLGLLVVPRNPVVWLLTLTPVLVALVVSRGDLSSSTASAGALLAFLGFQLLLGPLGEEFGWRGFLLPRLQHLGTLGAPVAVGVIWGLWHAPLWWLNSPQAQIPFGIFLAICVCFSIIMSAAHWLQPRSVLPAILFHWLANVSVGLLELNGYLTLKDAYGRLLPYYLAAALLAAFLNWHRESSICVHVHAS